MRATITVEVPDDFIATRAKELAEAEGWDPEEPFEYFRGRLEDVCGDELPLALFGWPAEFRLEVQP